MGHEMVPTIEWKLPLKKEKELNLRLNKNQAHWDNEKLEKHFDVEMLETVGFIAEEYEVSVFSKDKPETVNGPIEEITLTRKHPKERFGALKVPMMYQRELEMLSWLNEVREVHNLSSTEDALFHIKENYSVMILEQL